MPLYNWIKCIDGDLSYVNKDSKGNNQANALKWAFIYDEYLKEYGLNKMHKKLLICMRDKSILECDFILTKDRFKLTLIEMEEQKLKNMLSMMSGGASYDSLLIHLSKWVGYHLSSKNISVKDFYTLNNEYEKFIKLDNGKKIK